MSSNPTATEPRSRRGPLLVGLFAFLTLGGAAGARYAAVVKVEDALREAGFTWEGRVDTLGSVRWRSLDRPGLRADSLQVKLTPPFRADLDSLQITLDRLGGGAGATRSPGSPGSSAAVASSRFRDLDLPLFAHHVSLRWGEDVLAEELDGTLLPEVDLSGPGVLFHRTGELSALELRRRVELGPLSGEATLRASCAESCTFSLSMSDALLSHPLLADRALPTASLLVDGSYDRANGAIQARILFGGVEAELAGTVHPVPPSAELRLGIPPTPLSRVIDLFGPLIPEAGVADIRGKVDLQATWSYPSGAWTLRPGATGLAAEGLLPDSSTLRSGSLSWRAPSADGGRIQETGEGSPDWVPLEAAGLLPFAVMAAEDAGFRSHAGYDLGAMQEAIDAAAKGEELRGGSTLTQQLAKNLFLDGGERTLTRKLRELLYALEMERALGKERILELYLNIVELGPEVYGVGPASDAFFAKRPARLSAREAAFIASILRSPRSGYTLAMEGGRSPSGRIDLILDNMVELHGISEGEGAMAKRSGLRFVPPLR